MIRFPRAPRFSMRSLLIAVTVTCLWLGVHIRGTQRQKQAVSQILDHEGWVYYDFELAPSLSMTTTTPQSSYPTWLRDLLGVDFFHDAVYVMIEQHTDLRCLTGLPNLQTIAIHDTNLSDENMQYIASCKNVESFWAWDVASVTDAGAEHLRGLTNLRDVKISGARLTDKSLALFGSLENLTGLNLQRNSFSDEGIKHLRSLTKLRSVWLCGSPDSPSRITDASVATLSQLKALEQIGLQHHQLTDYGVTHLWSELPKLSKLLTSEEHQSHESE